MSTPFTDRFDIADLARRRVVYPDEAGLPGGSVGSRTFEDYPSRFTGLVHLPEGAQLPADPLRPGLEILVCEGRIAFNGVSLGRLGYARRPPGADPALTAQTDALIFVKRGHIPAEDRVEIILEPRPTLWRSGLEGALWTLLLHHHAGIAVSLMRYQPGSTAGARRPTGGEEILVLDGTLLDARSAYPRGSWLRNPSGSVHEPYSVEGCLLYLQTGHLPIL
jgi:hypothetical protein